MATLQTRRATSDVTPVVFLVRAAQIWSNNRHHNTTNKISAVSETRYCIVRDTAVHDDCPRRNVTRLNDLRLGLTCSWRRWGLAQLVGAKIQCSPCSCSSPVAFRRTRTKASQEFHQMCLHSNLFHVPRRHKFHIVWTASQNSTVGDDCSESRMRWSNVNDHVADLNDHLSWSFCSSNVAHDLMWKSWQFHISLNASDTSRTRSYLYEYHFWLNRQRCLREFSTAAGVNTRAAHHLQFNRCLIRPSCPDKLVLNRQ